MPEPLGTTALTPGFMIVHGNRLDDLRDLAVSWMRRYPLAPLESERVLVHSNGIAQWLKLALAEDPREDGGGGGGIAAALEVQLPAQFLWQAYRAVLGRESIPEVSELDKAPLTWRLMRLLPGLLERPEFRTLQRFLADDADLRKRHQLAERPGRPVRPVPGLSRRLARRLEPGPRPVAHGERAGAPARCRRALAGRIVARAARRRRCR